MSSDKLYSAWSDVFSLVKTYEGIDPTQINAFFSRLQPQALSEGFLMLTADNDFIKSWIERNYIDAIRRALEELHGVPFTVLIEVDPNQQPYIPAAAAQPAPQAQTQAQAPAPQTMPSANAMPAVMPGAVGAPANGPVPSGMPTPGMQQGVAQGAYPAQTPSQAGMTAMAPTMTANAVMPNMGAPVASAVAAGTMASGMTVPESPAVQQAPNPAADGPFRLPEGVLKGDSTIQNAAGQSPDRAGDRWVSDRPDPGARALEGTTVEMQAFQPEDGTGTDETPTSNLTFESYVIGDSNRMAYSMAVSVAENPGKPQLNPLFIYGRSGCGKTHLLRAIQNHIARTRPDLKTCYVDSAEFLSDYMEASAAHDREKSSFRTFKTRYENVDVLLIDDIQFLQGKKQTLDIVFQIFNKLTSAGRQVVLAADRAPKNIDIDDRYSSRFNSGGTFDIQAPEVETKLGVVKTFIEEYRRAENKMDFTMPPEIQLCIAENSNSNLRELKSAVTKVITQMQLFEKPNMPIEEVRRLLESHFSGGGGKRLTIADIQSEVEQFYKVSHADLVGKKRNRNITYARQVAIYLCRTLLDLSYDAIGQQFNRDHATVMYSINCVEDRMKENDEYREEVATVRQIVQEL